MPRVRRVGTRALQQRPVKRQRKRALDASDGPRRTFRIFGVVTPVQVGRRNGNRDIQHGLDPIVFCPCREIRHPFCLRSFVSGGCARGPGVIHDRVHRRRVQRFPGSFPVLPQCRGLRHAPLFFLPHARLPVPPMPCVGLPQRGCRRGLRRARWRAVSPRLSRPGLPRSAFRPRENKVRTKNRATSHPRLFSTATPFQTPFYYATPQVATMLK